MCQPSDDKPTDSKGGEDKGNVTEWLRKFQNGESVTKVELFALIEERLRQIAKRKLSTEVSNHSLQITALINELWIKLLEDDRSLLKLNNSRELYQLAAQAIRNILVSYARAKVAEKRGGGKMRRVDDHEIVDESVPSIDRLIDVLTLEEAMKSLAVQRPELVELVNLKFYAKCSIAQISEILGVSEATVERRWSVARAFLRDHMKKDFDVFDQTEDFLKFREGARTDFALNQTRSRFLL